MTQSTAADTYVPTAEDVAHYREHGWWVSPKIVPDDVLDAAQLGGERHYAGERDYPLLITGGYLDWRPEHGEMIRLNDYVSLQNEDLRQLQEQVFDGRYPSTVEGYDAPDFARVAEVYGIESAAVSEPDQVEEALEWLWRDPTRPSLLHVVIPMELNVYPNVPFGASISTMESFHSQPVAGGLFG